jgi:glyoxylase-like metal-dependent hydrolase (beta-lactamase superfamily II)
MKSLHRPDLFAWSHFDEARNVDFHGVAWIRQDGNLLIDPLPMSEHDRAHLQRWRRGGIVVTNSDHVRGAQALAEAFGATRRPRAERETFPLACALAGRRRRAAAGAARVRLQGSKTAGELALVIDGTTLVCGDLVRGHSAGRLNLLPEGKLRDRAAALASLQRIVAAHPRLDAVLVGDGWPLFGDGARALAALAT